MPYNSFYQPANPLYQTPQISPQGAILWVQGVSGAKAYTVPPGSNVLLMDSEDSVFYIKSTDASGMPTLRTFDYTERKEVPQTDYITRAEVEEMLKEIRNAEPPVSESE